MGKKRSKGIIIIGIIAILYSVTRIFSFFDAGSNNPPDILIGLGLFISSIAVLGLKNWGRISMICVALYDLFAEIISQIPNFNKMVDEVAFQLPDAPRQLIVNTFVLSGFMIAIFCTVIIFYLTRPKVKEQFKT